MRQPATKKYPAACQERAVPLAVESEQSLAQTARDLGVHANPLPAWIGTEHRAARQEPQGQGEPWSAALQRLRQEPARLQEARAIFTTAAASLAPPRP